MEQTDHVESPERRTEPESLGLLHAFLGRPGPEQTVGELLRILDQFVDPARSDGHAYMSEVLVESPNASREVDALRCAGQAGDSRLEELRDHVAQQPARTCISRDILERLQTWAQSLTAHRRHENRLVNESLNRDDGGES